MSHSQFHCTGRVYLDLHGLIFETSICYWQDQPGSPRALRERPDRGRTGPRRAGSWHSAGESGGRAGEARPGTPPHAPPPPPPPPLPEARSSWREGLRGGAPPLSFWGAGLCVSQRSRSRIGRRGRRPGTRDPRVWGRFGWTEHLGLAAWKGVGVRGRRRARERRSPSGTPVRSTRWPKEPLPVP